MTKSEKLRNQQISNDGLAVNKRNQYPQEGYKREMNRLMANLEFDVAIDFSGYSYFWARHILAANAESVESYLAGKDRALGFLIGQVMKLSKGKANPAKVNELILERLNKSK